MKYAEPMHLLLISFRFNDCLITRHRSALTTAECGRCGKKGLRVTDRERDEVGGMGYYVLQVIKRVEGADVTSAPTSPTSHSLFIRSVSVRIVDELTSDWLVQSARTEIPPQTLSD